MQHAAPVDVAAGADTIGGIGASVVPSFLTRAVYAAQTATGSAGTGTGASASTRRLIVLFQRGAVNFWTALSWSPDGNFIAYANTVPKEILVVGTFGGDTPRRIGASGLAGWAPAWAPR